MATVVAGAALERGTEGASAHHGGTGIVNADGVIAHSVSGTSAGGFPAVSGINTGRGYGVLGQSTSDEAGTSGVEGVGPVVGVRGQVYTDTGIAVLGNSSGAGPGVKGENREGRGPGVLGEGSNGVLGRSSKAGFAGVRGAHGGAGYGMYGSASGAGVLGVNGGTGPGVSGENPNGKGDGVSGEGRVGVRGYSPVTGGIGVVGDASVGYGALLRGAKAQLRLVPGATAGRPTSRSHARGELYMDSRELLYICVGGSTASVPAGTWKRVATVDA